MDIFTSHAARAKAKSRFYRDRIVGKSVFYRSRIIDGSLFCRDQIVDGSLFCKDQIVDGSLFCRDQIVDKSLFCKDQIVGKSLFCRDQIVGRSLSYRNQIVTTSLFCKNQVLDTIFGALRVIPVHYNKGEIVLLGREDFHDAAGFTGADEAGMKKIYILLTKHATMTARILRLFTWNEYTHSSISLERDGTHYSFNPVRGFTIERPIQKKRGTTPCKLYCVDVPDRTYAEIEARIKWFVDNPDEYKFNYVGLVFSILHIPIGIGNRYFCSQFVSDILTASDAPPLLKRPNSYFPRHFQREGSFKLTFNGTADTFDAADDTIPTETRNSPVSPPFSKSS